MDDFLFLTDLLLLRTELVQDLVSPPDVSGRNVVGVMLVECRRFDDGHGGEDLEVGSPPDRLDSAEDVCVRVRFSWEVDTSLLDDDA